MGLPLLPPLFLVRFEAPARAVLAALGFGLLGDLQRIVDLDAEVAHGALQPMSCGT